MNFLPYTVFYRKPTWFFWRKFKGITGDSQQYDQHMRAVPGVRVLYRSKRTQDDTRIEIPTSLIITFSDERKINIDQRAEAEKAAAGRGS